MTLTAFLFAWTLLLTIACLFLWYFSNHQIFVAMTVFHNHHKVSVF